MLDVGIAVGEALAYSHSRSVIHRDIKPENIMILPGDRNTSRVRVMDFGLARRTRVTALTKTGVIVGTVSYASPEQVSGGEIDGRSDLYSLGTVLYHCVTSQVPFTGELQSVLYRIVHEVPQPPDVLGAEIDDELGAIILSCLEKDPAMRPQTADDLTRTLVDYREKNRSSDRMNSTMISRAVQVPRPASDSFRGSNCGGQGAATTPEPRTVGRVPALHALRRAGSGQDTLARGAGRPGPCARCPCASRTFRGAGRGVPLPRVL